jgi:hypothetical protein
LALFVVSGFIFPKIFVFNEFGVLFDWFAELRLFVRFDVLLFENKPAEVLGWLLLLLFVTLVVFVLEFTYIYINFTWIIIIR